MPPWLGSYSIDPHVRYLKGYLEWGPTLYFSAFDGPAFLLFSCQCWCWHFGGESLWWWLHRTCDSAVSPYFPGCWAFLHRHFPPQSPPSQPFNLSLCSQQQPSPWDCSTIPKLQLPVTVPSRESTSLSAVCMTVPRTVWFSFRLGCHRSTVTLSALNVSPLTQTIALMWGLDSCFISSTRWGQVQPY